MSTPFLLKRCPLACLATILVFSSPAIAQQEVGFIEDFALAENREEALKQLIPGTEDFYYFHALHYQNTGQRAKYDEILGQWKKRFNNSNRRKVMERRQALLDYERDPKASLEFIRRELGLQFNHQQEGKAKERQYPSKLDQAEITWEKYLEQALAGTKLLDRLSNDSFFPLLESGRKLTPIQRRDLLKRARYPDLPGLVDLIAADLATKESRGFGEFPIHRALTIAQLDELRGRRAELLRNETYVHTYLLKLQPGADSDPFSNVAVREAYLNKAWAFVKDLEPSFNSLKAHLLYQRLEHDRSMGVRDEARFLEYVKLPRNVSYIRPEWRRDKKVEWNHPVDVHRNFTEVTGLPPIGGDEPLVREFLLHFFKAAKGFDAYAPYIRESWLKAVFAEAKIVNGLGDPEQWTSMLSPGAFQSLKDRVDLEFDSAHRAAPGEDGKPAANAEQFGINDPVKLRLHVKNVPKLIVKVFELNPLNHYLEKRTELSTDVNLDGLVANHERTVEYGDAPVRRMTRDFTFPEIGNRRGVWVVEFIGGGRSSRAVIRKGKLEALTRPVSKGVLVTVLNESHQPEAGAAVWFGGRRIECNEQGRALIPFSTDPGPRTLVVEDESGFASMGRFSHPAENYVLDAGIHVEGEALRPGAMATMAIRPRLTVAGRPVPLSKLSDVRLVLRAVDLDGITTTTTINDLKIGSDREVTHEFRVPERIDGIDAELRAKVKVASLGGEEEDLSAYHSFAVSGQLATDRVDDLFLSRIGGEYVLELLGRSGEPRVGRHVNVRLRHPGFGSTRNFTLKTNKAGVIGLGALKDITWLSADAPGGSRQSWGLSQSRRSQRGMIHVEAGQSLRVPFVGLLERSEVALLELAAETYVADHFDKLAFDSGFLVAKELEPGDYQLLLKNSNQSIRVRVAKGVRSGGFVFNEARTLEIHDRKPAHLVELKADDKAVTIEVANVDQLTRVHVFGTRFLPMFDPYEDLAIHQQPGLYVGHPAQLPNLFLSGRKIGDEFRYILERRYAHKLPGNMLERPELLLNPWAVRDTNAGSENLMEGEEFSRLSTGKGGGGSFDGPADPFAAADHQEVPGSLGFLAKDPVVMWNLRPDKNGRMKIKLDAFGDRQHVHVVVIDPDGATYRELSLADRGAAVRDLRLMNALDPKKHFTEQDSVTLMKKGERLEIPDILTAKFETFDNLEAAYQYLIALRSDATLREFSFVVRWPKLGDDEKRELYSKYACHELSFFLARKDPGFFEEVVVPHLSNKKDRTFMDDYLLGKDLSRYLDAFEYSRLNVPERILLAQRQPKRIDGIRMDLRDRISLLPPDLARETALFEGALAAFGMSGDKRLALDKAKEKAIRNATANAPAAEGAPAAAPRAANGLMRRELGKKMAEMADAFAEPAEEAKAKLEKSGRVAERKSNRARSDAQLRYQIDEAWELEDSLGLDEDMEMASSFFREIERTREWAENNYYKLPIGRHTYALIQENKFWLDYANHEGEVGFGSRHLGEAAGSFHEAMLALAVLDLPFESKEHKMEIEDAGMRFEAAGRVMAFHREIKEAKMAEQAPPLLVSQSFFRHDDRYRTENGEKVDKFVTDEFVAGVVYGGQVVVTNPTSSRQKLDALIQIPKGAMPVLGKRATATQRIAMEPYSTQRFEVFFYFPTVGDYPCYPAHVSKAGEVIAHAEAFTFKVVEKLSKVDEGSWAYISQWGTQEQVLEYLSTRNLHAVDLKQIAWRCRESRDFMVKALSTLNLRGVYDATLFSYGVMHDDASAVRQLLLMQNGFLSGCGRYLKSKLVTIDPIERRAYQHLEYKPLANNRAHRLGADHRILNDTIRGQYQQFLRILSEKDKLDDMDRMSTAYYLFLQDRAHEAMGRLDAVNADALPTKMQYDYFKAYAAFYQAKPAEARRIASRYKDYPVDRWRERFAAVRAQADEISGDAPEVNDEESREQQQAALAAKEPALDLKVEGKEVTLDYQNLDTVEVNYYEMDLEFLFSTTPFVSSDGGGFSIVKPNRTEKVRLAGDKRVHQFQLPRDYQAKNVLVEVVGGGKKRSAAVYANELQTMVSENFGILTVRHDKDGRPLSQVYVKVYVMTGSGPKFYKDGYTDLRGKFDYATVSTTNIAEASKFSVLVMSEEHGATVLEAEVPQR